MFHGFPQTAPDASSDQPLAAACGRGYSREMGKRYENRRCADEDASLESQFCRHALRWIAVLHDRSVLHVMLIHNLGPKYIVWDKAAHIRFRRPGTGTVSAYFQLTDAQLDEIRRILETQPKYEPSFTVEVKDESGNVLAEVQKILHIRKKDPSEGQSSELPDILRWADMSCAL